MVYYEYMMIMYRNRYNIWLKIITVAMVCLFFVDTVCWAYPDNNPGLNRNTLATQSIFKPLNDAGIHTSAEIEFEIVAGVRLLLAGKTPSAVNGILTETYRKSKDKRKIEFLPEVTREGDQSIARFNIIGNENIVFEIKYRAAKPREVVPIAVLTYGNVFQSGDEIIITKITGQASSLPIEHSSITFRNDERSPGLIPISTTHPVLIKDENKAENMSGVISEGPFAKTGKVPSLKKIALLAIRVFIPLCLVAAIIITLWEPHQAVKLPSSQKEKDYTHPIEAKDLYRIRSCEKFMETLGLPLDITRIIYGNEVDKIQVLEISQKACEILDDDQTVSMLIKSDLFKFRYMSFEGCAMLKYHSAVRTAVRTALGIEEELLLPFILLKKASIITLSHELTHVLSVYESENNPKSMDEYARDNYEREAFINSILVFRLVYPDKTFYDFARDGIDKENFSDETIDYIISKEGADPVLSIQKKAWDNISKHGKPITKNNIVTIEREMLKMLNDMSQKAETEAKLKIARAMHMGMEGVFVHHDVLYSSIGYKGAVKSAAAGTIFETIETSYVGESKVWIKIRIKKAIKHSYYDLPGCKDGDELWIKMDNYPYKFIPIEIKNSGEKAPIDRTNKSTDEKKTLKKDRSNNSRPTRFLSAENSDEKYLLSKTSIYLTGYPVNMRIDLTTIPRNSLTKTHQEEQLKQNMETLARLIAWHNTFDLNIRYILEYNTDSAYRDEVLAALKDKLVKLGAIPGIDVSELLLRIGPPHSGDGVIEISLKNLDVIKTIQSIPDNAYYVALKDDIEKPGVPMPNYTTAANMGLSLAALRIAKEKTKEKTEYNELRDKVLKVFRSIYKRYEVISEEEKFTADELELMVTGSSDTRLYYTILYALPPIVKAAIEEIRKYHESLHLLLQAA